MCINCIILLSQITFFRSTNLCGKITFACSILAAQTIWEMGSKLDNPSDFAMKMDSSDLKEFGFTDDFIFDLWGAISDAKSGRLTKGATEFNEQF